MTMTTRQDLLALADRGKKWGAHFRKHAESVKPDHQLVLSTLGAERAGALLEELAAALRARAELLP